MSHKVQIVDETHNHLKTIDAKDAELLHTLLVYEHGYHAPCGGNGTCHNCKVKLIGNIPYHEKEKAILSEEEIKENIHFACMLEVKEDLIVMLKGTQHMAAQDIYEERDVINPMVRRMELSVTELKKLAIPDYACALQKKIGTHKVNLEVIKKLPYFMQGDIDKFTAIYDDHEVLELTHKPLDGYGIAIDIGTTTVVSYLYNLKTGKYQDVLSDINHQRNFGFDVISRIKYAHEESGLNTLCKTITSQLKTMIESLISKNKLEKEQLDEVIIVGNTVMLHLLIGSNPKDIGVAPFTSVFTDPIYTDLKELGIKINNHCKVSILPSISSYVGADVVSGMLIANMHQEEQTILLVDIGTNGEIALLSEGEIACCATAAGPAFEGANITYGVGGISGAINHIDIKKEQLSYTTIHNQKPIGLCGSGLIDGIAYMLNKGYIDETGYLEGDDLVDIGEAALEIAKKEDAAAIYITQKDIREIQLAKGSIRAGIDTMLDNRGIKVEDVDKIYIAGGFGSFMNKESAVRIGLLPKGAERKIESIGNSAGKGAIKVLLNKDYLKEIMNIKDKCHYVELSNSVKFMDYYMQSMSFE